MKILVIGSGGREHALCWKISQSPLLGELYCAPGNPGTAKLAKNVAIPANDIPGLLAFAQKEKIDLTVVGPEEPLCKGIVDLFEKAKLKIFGPSQRAAELEGSKVFCKELLRRHKIPTAGFRNFDSSAQAMSYIETNRTYPIVVKASGLAAGKGVSICQDREQARDAVGKAMEEKIFGEAGGTIVIEEFLRGEEASVLTITDGETIIPLEPSQDHKTVFDNDQGPNTGGMGAICPTPALNSRMRYQVESQVLVPTIHAMNREGRKFQGLLYAGLMMAPQGPKVLEYNVRFGDPETQAVLMRMRSDIVPLLFHTAEGTLNQVDPIEWDPRPSVCVVATSQGYPGAYPKGKEITGLDQLELSPDLQLFHAGTEERAGKLMTAGGRVLSVTALGKDFQDACAHCYEALGKIRFEGMHYRKDIGSKALSSRSFEG